MSKLIFRKIKGRIIPILKRDKVLRPKPKSILSTHIKNVAYYNREIPVGKAVEEMYRTLRKSPKLPLKTKFKTTRKRFAYYLNEQSFWYTKHKRPITVSKGWSIAGFKSKRLKKNRKREALKIQKIVERYKKLSKK